MNELKRNAPGKRLIWPLVLLLAGCSTTSIPWVVQPMEIPELPQTARPSPRSESYSETVRRDIERWDSKLQETVNRLSNAPSATTP